ncbi:Chorismate synthase [Nitrospina gracilis 3/211]|uniref:Chorismate synthase n=1 Tax=Nitrospina gracilis (strain 3/211) TaxID=1266370 RepID=M1YWG9_NITG3|nr:MULTISPECIES: chorismate synthase [Nitrospina]MCF8722871.1 chorismate synthase [Nitrospina sp. Nb-3]CCQ89833.1 Chorismate synthase [Nitrospina gracilis 3/211]
MPGNTFGQLFRISTWGESHGESIGVVIDGCPAGLPITAEEIQKELDRRRTGQSKVTTTRKEPDRIRILSGVFQGKTTGTPLAMMVENADADSSKYELIKHLYRPGHADFTYDKKYGFRDYRGGGRSSARETVGRVAAGAIAKKLLARRKIKVFAYTRQIGDLVMQSFSQKEIENNIVRCPDKKMAEQMVQAILQARKDGDSLGGVIEVVAKGVPAGLGEPVFDRLDADLAKALMSLPAVKGVEVGIGFEAARLRGSECNDVFIAKNGKITTKTNNAGGVLGGISNGNDIVLRMVVKPTSSINREQDTVTQKGRKSKIRVEGRHDPCVAPRAVPMAEAMVALVLIDHLLRQKQAQL